MGCMLPMVGCVERKLLSCHGREAYCIIIHIWLSTRVQCLVPVGILRLHVHFWFCFCNTVSLSPKRESMFWVPFILKSVGIWNEI